MSSGKKVCKQIQIHTESLECLGLSGLENEIAFNHFKVWHSLRAEAESRAVSLRSDIRAGKCHSLC